jgi:hypothetical protein
MVLEKIEDRNMRQDMLHDQQGFKPATYLVPLDISIKGSIALCLKVALFGIMSG